MSLNFPTAKEAMEAAQELSYACGDECRFGCGYCRKANKIRADLKILHASHYRIKRMERQIKELRTKLGLPC